MKNSNYSAFKNIHLLAASQAPFEIVVLLFYCPKFEEVVAVLTEKNSWQFSCGLYFCMADHVPKRHNKNLLLYHVVCPCKYRRKVFTEEIEQTLRSTCQAISKRYEIHFIESLGAEVVPILDPILGSRVL